ncbi:conjugal transfer protein TrbE [Candidatus Magnetomorum sp. HK-1]|nr:conjugal transfer protein TrbE [Candidatus Magnetomorum sp. HK-1]
MFYLQEYLKQPKKLAHRLPWALLIAPGVVLNKTGSFQSTIEYRGPDLYSSTEHELDVISAQINNALKRLGHGWSYFIEAQRRVCYKYPESQWPNEACRIIDNERKRLFFVSGNHYVSRYFFTFSYITPSENVKTISDSFIKKPVKTNLHYEKYLEYFQEEMKKIVDILSSIFPYIKILDDDETLTYLHSCISTKYHPVKTPENPVFIDYILTDEILEGGLTPKLGSQYLKTITIKGFPHESGPQILSEMDSLDCEYRWMSRFICLDKLSSLKELKKYARQWFAKRKSLWTLIKEASLNEYDDLRQDNDAIAKSEECDSTSEMVSSNLVSAGYYTSCIVLWDADMEKLVEKLRSVEQVLNSSGFITVNESFNSIQAWFGSLPGHNWANIRRPLITSMNLTHMLPISTDWAGPEKNDHLNGLPLFYAKTSGNTPFRFSNHIGDVGHTMIVGPTGTGKSVFLNFMASQFLKYPDAQIYFFDKDYSAKTITFAMGGLHHDLGDVDNISFQPLKQINDEMERNWALEWLCNSLLQDNFQLTPAIKNEIWEALSNLASSPVDQHTMTGLVALLQNQQLREGLTRYTLSGPYGYLLDATEDEMEAASWQCFEMNYLMKYMPQAVVPVLTYLFHKLEQRFDGRPSMIILDEAWHFFSHPLFARQIKDWLKTLRKKNVSVIFATQSLSDMNDTPLVNTLVESCPTRIFMPNKKALDEKIFEQYRQFGLNEKQIDIIATSLPKCDYYCQSDIGNRKFELGLGPAAIALYGSATQQDLCIADEIADSDPDKFTNQFLKHKGVNHEC